MIYQRTATKQSVLLIIALLLCCMALVVGCSNSASTASGNGSGASAQAANASGGNTIKASDLAGHWVAEKIGSQSKDDLLKVGMLCVWEFDENGTFKMTNRLNDKTLERTGTYKIEDGKLHVSLPEMKEQISESIKLSGDAVDNAELIVDGDSISSTEISTDGSETVVKKVSDEQYQEYVDKVVALGPKRPVIGEPVEMETATFTVNSMSYVDEVYPSNTSGYYTYMKDQDGKTYLLVDVSFTNNGTEYAVPGYATQAVFDVGGNKYNGEIAVDGGTNFYKSYSVDAKDTALIHIYCAVPDSVIDSSNGASLTWSIPTSDAYMRTYYKPSFEHDDFIIAM